MRGKNFTTLSQIVFRCIVTSSTPRSLQYFSSTLDSLDRPPVSTIRLVYRYRYTAANLLHTKTHHYKYVPTTSSPNAVDWSRGMIVST